MLTDADGCYRIVQAMPPTSSYSFVYNIPVNNKWEVPATFLRIMRGINLPEFDLDFSQVYHLQYSASAIQVEHDFSLSTQSGDYLDTNNFTIFNGATDFQACALKLVYEALNYSLTPLAAGPRRWLRQLHAAYVSIRQRTSAYLSIRQHTSG
jgi:hypothetical protein